MTSKTKETSPNPRYKVIVIDDEPAVLHFIETVLTENNFQVTCCETAKQALDKIKKNHFDCMITDAIMPNISGFELIKKVRENSKFSHLQILMLTRKRDRQDVKKAVEAGANDYIIKPIDESLLVEKVTSCLNNQESSEQIKEVTISKGSSQANLSLNIKVISITETSILIKSPFNLTHDADVDFDCEIFKTIGIKIPQLKLFKSEKKDNGYEIRFLFHGLSDKDQNKVKSWINSQLQPNP